MRRSLLDVLACPECKGDLLLLEAEAGSPIISDGTLRCEPCARFFPIRNGIPRFIESHAADESFGFQWNAFRCEQLDSQNGAGLSAQRLWSETGWNPAELEGRRVLDVGCGAGRFLEVISQAHCDVVGLDVSSAIDAARETVHDRPNVDLVQADVYRMPFRDGAFDKCYCIGVAQHTPDPERTLRALPRLLKPGGDVAVTVYERRPWTLLNGKYLIRMITVRMKRQTLMQAIRVSMPILFPVTEVLFRIPGLGRVFDFFLPVANYVHVKGLTIPQRYQLALLDTFDRLAPQFDRPLTQSEVETSLSTSGIAAMRRQPNSGVNVVGTRTCEGNV